LADWQSIGKTRENPLMAEKNLAMGTATVVEYFS
jgi:hypothetical protein